MEMFSDEYVYFDDVGVDYIPTVFEDVKVFMEACDQPTDGTSPETISMYASLIKEESKELLDAIANESSDAQLKECFDLIWVVAGYMIANGWKYAEAWEAGTDSNFQKIDPDTGKVIKRDDGKVLKPAGWKKPDFSEFV